MYAIEVTSHEKNTKSLYGMDKVPDSTEKPLAPFGTREEAQKHIDTDVNIQRWIKSKLYSYNVVPHYL